MHIYQKMKTFLFRMIVTRGDTTHTNFTLYKLLTYCTCSSQAYRRSQRVMAKRGTLHQWRLSPTACLMLFCFERIQLLVEETNRYYHHNLGTLDDGRSPLPNVSIQEMCVYLDIIVKMRHNQRDTLKGYWSTLEQHFMAFYGNTMKRDRFYHIHRFLYFSDNNNEPEKTDENYDWLWKMRPIFDRHNNLYAKY
jgi:hypothetical protein